MKTDTAKMFCKKSNKNSRTFNKSFESNPLMINKKSISLKFNRKVRKNNKQLNSLYFLKFSFNGIEAIMKKSP